MQVISNTPSRRQWLQAAACGFGSLALHGLIASDSTARGAASQRTPALHHPPRAKRVIFIFMQGGPSQVDTWDHKPRLAVDDGKQIDFYMARTRTVAAQPVFKSPWKFRKYGQCGQWVSELFPKMAQHVDDYCFIKSMHTEGVAHGPATLFLHTGATNLIRPSVGAWVTYGLGSENSNLPGFITIHPTAAKGGPRNYSNAFLPAEFQGAALGRAAAPMDGASFRHIQSQSQSLQEQRRQLDFLQAINKEQIAAGENRGNTDSLDAIVASYELAFRMQSEAPRVLDLSRETQATLRSYGIGAGPTDNFGRQCLLARRFAEAGVRYIQISHSDNSNNPKWDQHSNLKKHADHALSVDQPIAALMQDLKQRGLLEDTLVWWGGEFGRTPYAQGRDGRDHNSRGFTVWLAGGGVKPGFSLGATDEHGFEAVDQRVHMHDLHATLLHLLGIDHTRLTFPYSGRDFRLTDVNGRVVREIMA